MAAFLTQSLCRRDDAKLLSDVGSEIRLVACSVTSARTSSLRNVELVSNIVNGLPPDVHVLLLVSDRSAFAKSAKNRRVTFVEMPPKSDISIWPQDPFVVVQGGAVTKLVTPCSFNREDDERMPRQLAGLLQLELVHSELHFEGGNIVCGEDAVFIGFDTIHHNALLLELSAGEVTQRFAKLFGRRVVVVGESRQSVRHIDLIVTPLSHQRIAVADSRAGAGLAAEAIRQEPALVREFERQCEKDFFGQDGVVELLDRDGNTISRPTVVGQTDATIASSLRLAPELETIARQLSQAGYKVVRVPALIPNQEQHLDEQGDMLPQYPFLSYSNVLTELRQNQSTVYLPQYGFGMLDNAAQRVWQEMGFLVKPLAGFSTSAMYGGAMRCCTKVLLRD